MKVLHTLYAPPKGDTPDSEYYNFYKDGAVNHTWEKNADKKHDELMDALFVKARKEQARAGGRQVFHQV